MRLAAAILRFERHMSAVKDLVEKDLSDYYVYTALAMECFQAANSLIEIGERIVVLKKLGVPSSYREIFEILRKAKLLSEEELRAAKRVIFLRNLIAHEYYRITEEELVEMVENLQRLVSFVEKAKKIKG